MNSTKLLSDERRERARRDTEEIMRKVDRELFRENLPRVVGLVIRMFWYGAIIATIVKVWWPR